MRTFIFVLAFLTFTLVNLGNLFSKTDTSREYNLFKEIRCLVCQGQTIHESNSELAEDIKLLVREKILEGESDDEIKQFLFQNGPKVIFSTYQSTPIISTVLIEQKSFSITISSSGVLNLILSSETNCNISFVADSHSSAHSVTTKNL